MGLSLFDKFGLSEFGESWRAAGTITLMPSGDISDYLSLSTTSNRTLVSATSANDNPLCMGKDAATGHSLDADDVIFGEDIEVNGMAWLDGGATLGTSFNIPDDILFTLGTDNDQAMLNRSTVLNANTALAGVLIGTPVTPALAANSFIIANSRENGDILIVGNDGGHSRTALFFDSSAPNTFLYNVGGTWTAGVTTWTIPAVTLGGAVAGGDQTFTGVGNMTYTDGSIITAIDGAGTTLLIKSGGVSGTTFITLTSQSSGTDTLDIGAHSISGAVDATGQTIKDVATFILGDDEGSAVAASSGTIRSADMVGGTTGNVAGADFTMAAGLGTGTGDVGQIILQTPRVTTAGSNIQTLTTIATFDAGVTTFTGEVNTVGNLNVGEVGIHNSITVEGVSKTFELSAHGNDTANRYVLYMDRASDTHSPTFFITRSRGSHLGGGPTVVVTGDILGQIGIAGYDGTDVELSSLITVYAEGTIADGRVPSRMVFGTGTDAVATVVTEALRIDSAQRLIFGSGEGGDGSTPAVGNIFRAPDIVGGTTSNVAGADLTFSAGLGTGTGDAGTLIFQLPEIVGAGSTVQTRASVLTMDMVASTTDMSFLFTPNTTIDCSGTLSLGALTLSGAIAGGDQAFTGVGDMTFTDGSIIAAVDGAASSLIFKSGGVSGTTFITLNSLSGGTDNMVLGKTYFYDVGGEYIESDGSNLTIAGAVIFPSTVYFNDAGGEYISSDGSTLTIAGAVSLTGATLVTAAAATIAIGDAGGINTGVVNDDYFTIGAVDNDSNTITEMMRFVGAATPYITLFNLYSLTIPSTAYPTFRRIATGGDIYFTLATNDADNTDDVKFRAHGFGVPGATDQEFIMLGWDSTNTRYGLNTGKAGSGTQRALYLDAFAITINPVTTFNDTITIADTKAINTGVEDDDYLTIGADDTGVGIVEVARAQGAADPYFSTGGSQEFKFYYSGAALFGSVVTTDAATMEIGNAGVIKSGATAADTLLLAANDTTLITLTTGAPDTMTLGAFLADGAIDFSDEAMTNVNIDSGAIGGVTLDGTITVGEIGIQLDSVIGTNQQWSGITTAGTLGATVALGEIVMLQSDDKWDQAQGDTEAHGYGMLGICLDGGNDTDATTILLQGFYRDDTAFEYASSGQPLYLSDTAAGDFITTKPDTTNDIVRIIGYAGYTKEEVYFNPDGTYVTIA